MNITSEDVIREEYSRRGGGVEIDLTRLGYTDQNMTAYQNYLGGGMLGAIANDCTIKDWRDDEKLVDISKKLRAYYNDRCYHDEYNEDYTGRPVSGY